MSGDLYKMLRSPQKRDFRDAVDALRGIPIDQAIRMLDELCNDQAVEFRCRGLDGLTRIAPDYARNLCGEMLTDIDAVVRWRSVYTIWILRDCSAAHALVIRLKTDSDEIVRSWAALALGDIGDASVLPALEVAAASDNGTDHEGRRISDTARVAIHKIMHRNGN